MNEILTELTFVPPPPFLNSLVIEGLSDKFWEYQRKRDHGVTLAMGGKYDPGNDVGIAWDGNFSAKINTITTEKRWFTKNRKKEDTTEEIFGYFGINILDKYFPLYDNASGKTDALPKVHFWHGKADTIGWYKDSKTEIERYVIVDWKVLDILNFWEKNKNVFGKFFHQCLIYARLLQLHMDLYYLPHILIVPISSITDPPCVVLELPKGV